MLKDHKNKSNKAVLQSGLDAVFGKNTNIIESKTDGKHENTKFEWVDINQIKRNPSQPRKIFSEDTLIELAESIKIQGILQPLLLKKSKNEEHYVIIAGERRYRAAMIAGLTEVPAIIKELSDENITAIAIIENIQRENLNTIEEAEAYHRLLTEFNLTHEEVAKKVGKSRATVTNMMRLLDLVEEVKQQVINNQISYGHARAILGLPTNKQAIVAQQVITRKLSVREVEKICRQEGKDNASVFPEKKQESSFNDQKLLKQLEQAFYPMQVKLMMKSSEEGRVELIFKCKKEINSILTKL